MRAPLRFLIIAGCLPLCLGSASARPGGCQRSALDHLKASAPDGYAIYRQLDDPGFFQGWIRCDDAQFDLSTAVHESTHVVTSEIDAFPLVGGGTLKLPHQVSRFYPPTRIAKRFEPDDFTTIYLRLGKASSSTDFLYLLDELNAYTHDLDAAVDLKGLVAVDQSVDHRDGLAALMAFVAVYAETAEASEPATWAGLRSPDVAAVVSTLWGQAERVMASSCGIPDFGTADKDYIRRYCAAPARAALEPILGRAPICPTACLQPVAEEASEPGAEIAGKPIHRSVAGPAWIETIVKSRTGDVPTEAETR